MSRKNTIAAIGLLVSLAAAVTWLSMRNPWPIERDRQIVVRVELPDGSPASAAVVRVGEFRPELTIERWRRGLRRSHPWLEQPAAAAVHHSDATGSLLLPWQFEELGTLAITAELGELWAADVVSTAAAHGSEHVLRLAPDRTLTVRVVDDTGAPCERVPVTVIGTTRDDQGGEHTGRQLDGAFSDEAGRVTFRHTQLWASQLATGQETVEVIADLPGHAVTERVDALTPPGNGIVLHIPPAGRIELRAVCVDGKPLPDVFTVGLKTDGGPDWGIAVTAGSTTTVFEHVAFGRQWQAYFPFPRTKPTSFAGPTGDDPIVRIELPMPTPLLFSGQLMLAGEPCADTDVRFDNFCLLKIDGQGRFDAPAMIYEFGQKRQQLVITLTTADGRQWQATWNGDLELVPARHELGVLELQPKPELPILVCGRVVTADEPFGIAIEKLEFSVCIAGLPSRPGTVDALVSTVRPDGSFVIRGEPRSNELALSATIVGFLPRERIRFSPGDEDLIFELRRGRTVRVAIDVASREQAISIDPRLARVGAQIEPAEPDLRRYADGKLTCTWRGLPAARYVFGVWLQNGDDAPLVKIDGVQVRDQDVQLADVSLPPFQIVRIDVELPSIADTDYAWVRPTANTRHRPQVTEDGPRSFLLATDRPVDLNVSASGCADTDLSGVFADTRVTLDPGIRVELDLQPVGLPAGLAVDLQLERNRNWHGIPSADALAVVYVTYAGECEVTCKAYLSGNSRDLVCEPSTITVPEAGGRFTIQLRPPP